MIQIRLKICILALLAIAFLSGCNTTRNVKEGEYLLKNNKISVDKKTSGLKDVKYSSDDLYGLMQQPPNKALLGILKVGLYVNSVTSRGKQTKIKGWINKKMGQKPVIYDEGKLDPSIRQLEIYWNNKGYFNSEINTSIKKKKKKAIVSYDIKLSKPHLIEHISYVTADTAIERIVMADTVRSLIKVGNIYNASTLDDERYRISSLLRNEGYYYFAPEFIFFEIDSAFQNHSLKIYANIDQVFMPNDTNSLMVVKKNHQKYYLNQISINPDFNPIRTDTSKMQSIVDTSDINGNGQFNIYYHDKLKIKPLTLRNAVFMDPSQHYREDDEKNTYKQLSSLPLFGYTALNFKPAPEVSDPADTTKKYIDCFVELTRQPVQSFSIETEGTTSGSKLGLAGNFVYRNLNIFRGGEVLSVKLTGGIEWQAGSGNKEPVLLFFNTVQTGAEATLNIPKFLLPIAQKRTSKALRPRTTIKTGINYQNRPDYERYVSNVSFGYNWLARNFVSHNLIPLEINSVSIFPDTAFVKRLEELNDPRLTNQYTDHFIMAAKYAYTFNNQQRNKTQNFTFFRWNFETAGNVLNLGSTLFDANKNENNEYTVWGIPFAQYARTDIDFRYYFALREEHTLVYRNVLGIGIPYGNSNTLPFEKGFYAGGSNGMRGWNYRTLGPGSFVDTINQNFERMGDIILEANLEYRFPIYAWLKGAFFTDIGNIWLLNLSDNYPGGKFELKNFMSELAIDAGFGLRVDLNFFIFRVDAAVPVRDPVYSLGQRWRFNDLQINRVIWNFGIGYPF